MTRMRNSKLQLSAIPAEAGSSGDQRGAVMEAAKSGAGDDEGIGSLSWRALMPT